MQLWATSYFVPTVHAVGEDGVPLLDVSGAPLGPRLSLEDWCDAAMEGSVHVVDATSGERETFNYASSGARAQVSCQARYPRHPAIAKSRFRRARGPYGDGVDGLILVPYRTIAVDPSVIPVGSMMYVPTARGASIRLPNGEERVHDGYFFAADRGGAIRGNHVDVFSGIEPAPALPFVQSRETATFDAYHVLDPDTEALFLRAHGAVLERAPLVSESLGRD